MLIHQIPTFHRYHNSVSISIPRARDGAQFTCTCTSCGRVKLIICYNVPYSGKLSREKTFADFVYFRPSAKVFSANLIKQAQQTDYIHVHVHQSWYVVNVSPQRISTCVPVHHLHSISSPCMDVHVLGGYILSLFDSITYWGVHGGRRFDITNLLDFITTWKATHCTGWEGVALLHAY